MPKLIGSVYADLIIAGKRKIENVAENIKADTYFYLVKKEVMGLNKVPKNYKTVVQEMIENEKN